jgi:hypothetical protein
VIPQEIKMNQTILETRLAALQNEFSSGKQLLAEHEAKAAAVREQLLRISGAIRVLSELLVQPPGANASPEPIPAER